MTVIFIAQSSCTFCCLRSKIAGSEVFTFFKVLMQIVNCSLKHLDLHTYQQGSSYYYTKPYFTFYHCWKFKDKI